MSLVSVRGEKLGDDARAIAARYKAALGIANERLESGAACQARVREQFAIKGK